MKNRVHAISMPTLNRQLRCPDHPYCTFVNIYYTCNRIALSGERAVLEIGSSLAYGAKGAEVIAPFYILLTSVSFPTLRLKGFLLLEIFLWHGSDGKCQLTVLFLQARTNINPDSRHSLNSKLTKPWHLFIPSTSFAVILILEPPSYSLHPVRS